MSTFTIDAENNITCHAELPTGTDESQSFSNSKELARLTADWPVSRLVETWNSFAGVSPFDDLKPTKKFTSRKVAVARIWDAVQRLSGEVTEPATSVAARRTKPKKSSAKAPRRTSAKGATEARLNKKAAVIAMMKRAKGATLAEITEATGWQKHTIRGFVSVLGSKGGQKIESAKSAAGERSYRIAK
jgi:hypothetical protein